MAGEQLGLCAIGLPIAPKMSLALVMLVGCLFGLLARKRAYLLLNQYRVDRLKILFSLCRI